MRTDMHRRILFFMSLLAALVCGCRDDAAIRTAQSAPAADLLTRAGWERAAKNLPATQTVGDYLAAQSAQPLDWTAQSLAGGNDIAAASADRGAAFHLTRLDDDRVLLRSGNSAENFTQGLTTSIEAAPWKILTRLNQVHRQMDGSARYRWAGCMIYDGPAPAGEIELRATLLATSGKGERLARPGKPRHATRRSGIPKWIQKGEFLCTELMSAKLDTDSAADKELSAIGVLEMTYAFQDGRRRFVTLAAQPLDWREYSQLVGQPLAVVRGGEFKTKNTESAPLPDPSLVTLLKQDGRDLLVRSSDGRQGLIKQNRVLARFDTPAPELSPTRRERLTRLIRLALSGQPRKTLSLFDEKSRTRHADATAADVARRYPPMENAEALAPVIQPLSLDHTPQGDVITVFVWIKNNSETVWQTLDTVLFDGDTMSPIALRMKVSD